MLRVRGVPSGVFMQEVTPADPSIHYVGWPSGPYVGLHKIRMRLKGERKLASEPKPGAQQAFLISG